MSIRQLRSGSDAQGDGALTSVLGTALTLAVTITLVTATALHLSRDAQPEAEQTEMDLAVATMPGASAIRLVSQATEALAVDDLLASISLGGNILYEGPLVGLGPTWDPGEAIEIAVPTLLPAGASVDVAIIEVNERRTIASTVLHIPDTTAAPATLKAGFAIEGLLSTLDGAPAILPFDPSVAYLVEGRVTHPEGRKFLRHVYADLSAVGGPAWIDLNDDGSNGDVAAGDGAFSTLVNLPVSGPPGLQVIRFNAIDLAGTKTTLTLHLVGNPTPPGAPPAPQANPGGPSGPFEILPTGGIKPTCTGPSTIYLEVVGSEITYGANGPPIPVWASVTTNGGVTLTPLFGGAIVEKEDSETLPALPPGSILGIWGHAKYESFDHAYYSYTSDPHVRVLKNGDPVPDVPGFANQQSIEEYLQPYVNTDTQTMKLAKKEVIILYEFNPSLSSSAADFQDLVVLVSVGC